MKTFALPLNPGRFLSRLLSRRGARDAASWPLLLGGAVLTFILFGLSGRYNLRHLEQGFRQDAATRAGIVIGIFKEQLAELDALKRFFDGAGAVSRRDFGVFVGPVLEQNVGLRGFAWIPRVSPAARAALEARARAEGLDQYRVVEQNGNGGNAAASPRDFYYPIYYIEPKFSNKDRWGFDEGSDPIRLAALEHSRDTAQAVVSEPVLIQEAQGAYTGFVVFLAVYEEGKVPPDVNARRRRLKGFVEGVFMPEEVLKAAIDPTSPAGLPTELFDLSTAREKQCLALWTPRLGRGRDLESDGRFVYDEDFPFAGRTWRVRVRASRAYVDFHQDRSHWALLPAGFLLTGLLALYFHQLKTEKERAEALVHERTAALRTLSTAVDQNPASIIITDENGVITYVNPKFCEVTGYAPREVLGQNPRVLKSGEQPREFYEQMWNTLLSGKVWRGQFHNKKKNGELFWELSLISPIRNEEGAVTHFVAVKEDVTHQKQVEDEARIQNEQLKNLNGLKNTFLGMAAHDLRSPLALIKMTSDVLAKADSKMSAETQKEFIAFISRGAGHMIDLLNNLLDVSQIESGRFTLNKEPVAAADFFAEVASHHTKLAAPKNTRVVLEAVEPGAMDADPIRLNQVMDNLVSNAVKFSPPGSVVRVRARRLPEHWRVEVEDQGPGLSEDDRKKLFQDFARLSAQPTGGEKSTGLGLAITRRVVEAHGGTIGVEPRKDRGTLFYFTLPHNGKAMSQAAKKP